MPDWHAARWIVHHLIPQVGLPTLLLAPGHAFVYMGSARVRELAAGADSAYTLNSARVRSISSKLARETMPSK